MNGDPPRRDELTSGAAAGAIAGPAQSTSAGTGAAAGELPTADGAAGTRGAALHSDAPRAAAGPASAAAPLADGSALGAALDTNAVEVGHGTAPPPLSGITAAGVTAAGVTAAGATQAVPPDPAAAAEAEAEAEAAKHADKMRKRKAARDKMMAGKTIERGLLVVHTGAGKGKSTAAFGMVMRCIGHGMPVGIVQFIKGRLPTGETAVLERYPDLVTLKRMGEGFTWETQDRARDIAAARAAWEAGREMIASGAYAMVLLDELNIALRYDYLPLAEVLAGISARPQGVHVVVTGRNAREELVAAADLVTEMTMLKHPFRAGVKPQAGIEF